MYHALKIIVNFRLNITFLYLKREMFEKYFSISIITVLDFLYEIE